ncbi:SMI1/KNR4 family protein [Streptomyces sp. NPDC093546]|uniref:SMI1/KNR4 family protein n=1 Tax=Streptomyces sp. NPDC093546 TaxID=3366040 RepID=UPI0037FA3BF5
MWKEAAAASLPDARFRPPVEPPALAEAERRLGRSLPPRLIALLSETDRITDPQGTDVVWDHETDSRMWAAGGLKDYVGRALAGAGDRWR